MAEPSKKSPITIDLNRILNCNDAAEVKRMKNELELNGWCFILLSDELIPDVKLVEGLSEFFQSEYGKEKYSQSSQIYGYSKTNHKEGIKFLTGSYFNRFANFGLIPVTILEALNYLSHVLDAVTKRLIKVLDQHSVFKKKSSLSSLTERANLPWKDEHFGMFDIVSYFNEKTSFETSPNGQTTEEVNCIPHFDPGLLSISILSTHEGLQLKDMTTDQWIDGPLESNIGVLWLGEAAVRVSKDRLKPGIHRVIYPREQKRRLTIWYELCTIEQLRSISIGRKDEPMTDGKILLNNLPNLNPIPTVPGESKLDFLRRIEMAYGLSVGKIGPQNYVLEQHAISYPMTSCQTKCTLF